MSKKIDIPFIEFKLSRIIKPYDHYIILGEDNYEYKIEYRSEETIGDDDDSLGLEKVMRCVERFGKRNDAASVQLEYIQATKNNEHPKNMWLIAIHFRFVDDIKLYMEDEKIARKIHSELINWIK